MNNWDEYDIYEGMNERDKTIFNLILWIFLSFVAGIFCLMLVYFEFKSYNDLKKSGDWIVCEARYVDTTRGEVFDFDGDKTSIYIHHFEYEAPDGKIYEHLEKSKYKHKDRVSYELVVKNNSYSKSRMKPYEVSGLDDLFKMGIFFLIASFIMIIIFRFRGRLIV